MARGGLDGRKNGLISAFDGHMDQSAHLRPRPSLRPGYGAGRRMYGLKRDDGSLRPAGLGLFDEPCL